MPRNNELPSYETLLEFQEVYLRAIALSWSDDAFRQALLTDAESALRQYFGYICPWTVKLSVQEPEGDCGWNSETKTWSLPRNKISVGVPQKPKDDAQSVALAAYNDAGPTYLFTCC